MNSWIMKFKFGKAFLDTSLEQSGIKFLEIWGKGFLGKIKQIFQHFFTLSLSMAVRKGGGLAYKERERITENKKRKREIRKK